MRLVVSLFLLGFGLVERLLLWIVLLDLFADLKDERGVLLLDYLADLVKAGLHLLVLDLSNSVSKLNVHFNPLFFLEREVTVKHLDHLKLQMLDECKNYLVVFLDLENALVILLGSDALVEELHQHKQVALEVHFETLNFEFGDEVKVVTLVLVQHQIIFFREHLNLHLVVFAHLAFYTNFDDELLFRLDLLA